LGIFVGDFWGFCVAEIFGGFWGFWGLGIFGVFGSEASGPAWHDQKHQGLHGMTRSIRACMA